MFWRQHNDRNAARGSWLGELLLLIAALLLGLAVMVLFSAVTRAPVAPADIVATAPVDATPTAAASTEPPLLLVPATPLATPEPTAIVSARTGTPVPPTPAPNATSVPSSTAPPPVTTPLPATRIQIPSVGIDTSVVDVGYNLLTIDNQTVRQMQVADYAAGHDQLSANPGGGGNIVISGHDDWRGEVFKNLYLAKVGDEVLLTTANATHRYVITEIHYRL